MIYFADTERISALSLSKSAISERSGPSNKVITWSEQGIKDIDNGIHTGKNLDPLNSEYKGRIVEAKVGEFVRTKKEVTGFGLKLHPSITDLDVATFDEIIEVKATFNTVKEDQFIKLLDETSPNFCNPNKKKVILYVDEPLSEATEAQVRMINRIKSSKVIFVNSLEELEKNLK